MCFIRLPHARNSKTAKSFVEDRSTFVEARSIDLKSCASLQATPLRWFAAGLLRKINPAKRTT
jgi:hypothetical protein